MTVQSILSSTRSKATLGVRTAKHSLGRSRAELGHQIVSLSLAETRARLGLRTLSLAISRKNLGHNTASLSLTRSRAHLGHSIKRTRRSRTQLLGLDNVNLGLLLPPSTSLPSSCSEAGSPQEDEKRPGFADWGTDVSAQGPLEETLLAWIPYRTPIPFARTRT